MTHKKPRPSIVRNKGRDFVNPVAAARDFAVIDAVANGIDTRTAIAEHLGLRKSYVSTLVKRLIDADVLDELPGKKVRLAEVEQVG